MTNQDIFLSLGLLALAMFSAFVTLILALLLAKEWGVLKRGPVQVFIILNGVIFSSVLYVAGKLFFLVSP